MMYLKDIKQAANFWVIGINYRKASMEMRGQYAVSDCQYEAILKAAPAFGISSLFVLSTCNRTELYGFAPDVKSLTTLLCSYTEGSTVAFEAQAYSKSGEAAIGHIFRVAAGLDSQILGDYEIVGQMKRAFQFSKEKGYTCTFLDRLFNTVLQSSRAIRAGTHLSSGTVSVAFAAVQFISTIFSDLTQAKILVIGSGEIGRNACRNLVTMAGTANITLTNRTAGKADALAAELDLKTAPFDLLHDHIRDNEVIIVATSATKPLITSGDLTHDDKKLLIDLSVPNNIDAAVRMYPGVMLANVDDLSRINDETLRKRQMEVPKAQSLIHTYILDFTAWCAMQQHVPVLKAVKEKLCELNVFLTEEQVDKGQEAVQKAINTMAKKMQTKEQRPGCNYIETIHHYLAGNAV